MDTSKTFSSTLPTIQSANAAKDTGANGTKRTSVSVRASRKECGELKEKQTGQGLLPLDGHASLSVTRGSAEARTITVISGQRCSELLTLSGRSFSLARMCLESLAWNSTRCFLTWKASATPAKRLIFRLVESEPSTSDIGFGWLPTPTKNEDAAGGTSGKMQVMLSNHPWIRQNGGFLSPEWTEIAMGYPAGWTELEQSGMRLSRKLQRDSCNG